MILANLANNWKKLNQNLELWASTAKHLAEDDMENRLAFLNVESELSNLNVPVRER